MALPRPHAWPTGPSGSATNSPVNHVGMSVVIEDLPPLMWHAELGRSLEDLWSGTRQRGVQLHDLRAAVGIWTGRYHQHAWLRQLEHPPLPGMEDAVLRTIARLDGTPFPSHHPARRPVAPRPPARAAPGTPRRAPGRASPAARPGTPRGRTGPWRRRTARRSWRPPTRPWACCPAAASRSGTTPAGSGAATSWNCWTGPGWAARSPSRSPPLTRPADRLRPDTGGRPASFSSAGDPSLPTRLRRMTRRAGQRSLGYAITVRERK